MSKKDRVAVPDFFGVVAGVIGSKTTTCPCRVGFDFDNPERVEAEVVACRLRDPVESPGCYAIFDAIVINTELKTRPVKSLHIHHFQSEYVHNVGEHVIITGIINGLDGPNSANILSASAVRFEKEYKPESDLVQFMLKTIRTSSMIAKLLSMRDGFCREVFLEKAAKKLESAFLYFNLSGISDGFNVASYEDPPLILNFKPPESTESA